ncbi:TPA: hypothetical protein O8T91_002201, partial [Enterobacter cloacae]|nr:hypothetical protein [Enterobacter cloacae]
MATTPTTNPVPSEKPQDLKFNAGKIDEFVTSPAHIYTDRFGNQHWTISGINYTYKQAIAQFGYITLDSFEDGNDITLPNQVLRLESTGEYYRWDGAFPKNVPENSTPETTGGIGAGAWVSVGDAALRMQISQYDGFKLVGKCPDLATLRSIEPENDGQAILVESHTAGYRYGGGQFTALLNGSAYTDDNGNYIKTISGSVWIREKKDRAYAEDYGLIVNDQNKAASNSAAIVSAARFAFNNGLDVKLPFGMKYIDDVVLDHPVTISGNDTIFGASLVNIKQSPDIIHV